MTNVKNTGMHHTALPAAGILLCFAVMLTSVSSGFPSWAKKAQVEGPWELIVQMGEKGQMQSFPVTVEDSNKEAPLNQALPVMGTPISITLERYLPNLTWDTKIIEQSDGGAVAALVIKGPNLEQQMWLSSGDPARQAMTSSIGGVVIKRVERANTLKQLVDQVADTKVVGVVCVRPKEAGSPYEFLAKKGESGIIPISKYQVQILEYMPHYSVDTQTGKVINQSETPTNPAVCIRIDDGQRRQEQWVWSNFKTSPHSDAQLPIKINYTDFNLEGMTSSYILACAPDSEPWLFFNDSGKRHAVKAIVGKIFPFAKKDYSFMIEKYSDHSGISMVWRNQSDTLTHPAIVASIEYNNIKQQAVLEINQPYHQKTAAGTLVLLYQRQQDASENTKNIEQEMNTKN